MIIQSMPYPNIATDLTMSLDGVWTWFSDPRAISVNGQQAVATVTHAGRIGVYKTDQSFVDLRGSLFQKDDHANPSLLKRSSDNKILAFACAHNGTGFYTYLSTNANDVSAFGAETNIDAQLGLDQYSYSNPVQLTAEANAPIYLFFRAYSAGTASYYYSKSTDQGATWAAATKLLSNDGSDARYSPYVKMVQNGTDRIDFFCTDGHPQHSTTNSIYHFYYQGGSFRKTDGTALSLPITPSSHLTKVYDGTTTKAWIWDCAVDGSGKPCCVYATFSSNTDHRYRYAIWNGASWADNQVCTAGGYLYAGEVYYSGGVAIDPANVNKVFASRAMNGVHQIYRYETANSGSTWTEEQMTATGERCFRPFIIRGQVREPRLAYLTGSYTNYTEYQTSVVVIDSRKSPIVTRGSRIPAGDMNSGSDVCIPAGDMNSGSDIREHQEITFG